jgi:branched-chain amino acid transport system substrate-binding protein
MKLSKRWVRLLAGVAPTLLVVAACSSAGSSGTASNASSAQNNPKGTPIKIGLLYAATTASSYYAAPSVANAWASWVNSKMGGVNGHPVQIVAQDDQFTAEGAAAGARNIVQAGAEAVILESPVAGSAAPYFASHGVPIIGGVAFSMPPNAANTWFPTEVWGNASLEAQLLPLLPNNYKSVAMIVCEETPSCAQTTVVWKGQAAKYGIDMKGYVEGSFSATNFIPQCLAITKIDPQVLALFMLSSNWQPIMQSCNTQGYAGQYLEVYNNVNPEFIKSLPTPDRGIGVLNAFPPWANVPAAAQYRAVMSEYGATSADVMSTTGSGTWTALELFRTALQAHGPAASAQVTSQDVIAAYHQVKNETLGGLLPQPITYNATGTQPAISCGWVFRVASDGTIEPVPPTGTSGNGVTGDLGTWCTKS